MSNPISLEFELSPVNHTHASRGDHIPGCRACEFLHQLGVVDSGGKISPTYANAELYDSGVQEPKAPMSVKEASDDYDRLVLDMAKDPNASLADRREAYFNHVTRCGRCRNTPSLRHQLASALKVEVNHPSDYDLDDPRHPRNSPMAMAKREQRARRDARAAQQAQLNADYGDDIAGTEMGNKATLIDEEATKPSKAQRMEQVEGLSIEVGCKGRLTVALVRHVDAAGLVNTSTGLGTALCRPGDPYDAQMGAGLAIARALRSFALSEERRVLAAVDKLCRDNDRKSH